ncbi:DUF6083 domain-containing protein [Streptomyces sp900105245]|uniref:DUF6083 domain-containing protein n=1 Tax=Streptomyces sp. 900105245 TaxID=3154379 RepID=UPI003320BD04
MGDTDSIVPFSVPGPDGFREPAVGSPRPWEAADRAQAARDGATGPEPPDPPVCPAYGLAGERRPTCTGRHALLRPAPPVPAHLAPGVHRRHVDGNGVAWNGGPDEPPAGTTCRIPHRLACPGLSPSADEIRPWSRLAETREHNALPARRKADEEAVRRTRFPDAG